MAHCGHGLQRVERACLAGTVFAALGISDHALAQGEITVPETEVVGHYETGVGTTDAASEGRFTQQLIEDRPILRPGEVFEFVPGMAVTQHSGGGKANQYFLRGYNLDHGTDFAITVAGMPVNMPTHGHGQGYADINFIIPELISSVGFRGAVLCRQRRLHLRGCGGRQLLHQTARAEQSRPSDDR